MSHSEDDLLIEIPNQRVGIGTIYCIAGEIGRYWSWWSEPAVVVVHSRHIYDIDLVYMSRENPDPYRNIR